MIDEPLENQAALYAAGALTSEERGHFELILKFHTELRAFVGELEEAAAAAMLASLPAEAPLPSPALRTRLLGRLDGRAQRASEEGFVVTGPDGLVKWVNCAFIAMCGYEIDELRGKKLGPILQGAQTDRAAAERLRCAVHERRPCVETILNYHKNGEPYWVEISLTPIAIETGSPRWIVATERKIAA